MEAWLPPICFLLVSSHFTDMGLVREPPASKATSCTSIFNVNIENFIQTFLKKKKTHYTTSTTFRTVRTLCPGGRLASVP